MRSALEGAGLVIDAVVGTGFKPPLRGMAVVAQRVLAGSEVPVVAVDLPSGWDADSTEEKAEGAFRADAVVTFTAPKLAHVFGHLTAATFGPVVVAGIGTPEGAIESATGLTWGGSAKAIAEAPRAINGNKGRLGHVLLVGGSFGKAGAPSMASVGALRAGAGLVDGVAGAAGDSAVSGGGCAGVDADAAGGAEFRCQSPRGQDLRLADWRWTSWRARSSRRS